MEENKTMTVFLKCDKCYEEFLEEDGHYILRYEGCGLPDVSCPLHYCFECGQKLKQWMQKEAKK